MTDGLWVAGFGVLFIALGLFFVLLGLYYGVAK
jgi:hypothetical protein